MKECRQCYKEYDDSWNVCLNCNTPLITTTDAGQDELSLENLNALFDKDFKKPFLPGDNFYGNWSPTDERLSEMVREIFQWLKIDDHLIPVRYAKGMKEPGLYARKEKEAAIFVSEKYKQDPFQVGAILAHECMHHYMHVRQLESPETKKNELKTDLATICAGLGILIINGMSYRSHWYITVILVFLGRIYINERRRSFGYFTPQDYCAHFNHYLKLKSLDGSNVIGYIHPQARSFLPKEISKKGALTKSVTIQYHEKKHKSALVVQSVVTILGVSAVLSLYYLNNKEAKREGQKITTEFQTMKQQITDMETKLQQNQVDLARMKKDLDYYETTNDTANYGKILIPYEDLKKETQKNYKLYQLLIKKYNYRIEGLKANRR